MYTQTVTYGIWVKPDQEDLFTNHLESLVATGVLQKYGPFKYKILATQDDIIYLDNAAEKPMRTVICILGLQVEGPLMENPLDCWVDCEPNMLVYLEKMYGESVQFLTSVYTDVQTVSGFQQTSEINIGWGCFLYEEKN